MLQCHILQKAKETADGGDLFATSRLRSGGAASPGRGAVAFATAGAVTMSAADNDGKLFAVEEFVIHGGLLLFASSVINRLRPAPGWRGDDRRHISIPE
jgi:hypothetical protein